LAGVDLDLVGDETVIWQGHPTWRSMLAFHIKWFAITLLVVGALLLVDWLGLDLSTMLIVAVGAAGVALTILAGWIQRFFTEYAITTKRLHTRRGILSKVESSTSVDRVQNITIRQGPIDRLLRCGSLEFDTAGHDDDPADDFDFDGVNSPQELRNQIMRSVGAASQGGLG
jgi:membrane protein YdbS with pleckstrin-like domain